MTQAREIIARLGITDAWVALGGPPLRHGRGPAFWREGDGYNVSICAAKNVWRDHVTGEGGGVLHLIEAVLRIDRRQALAWCADMAGVPLDDRPYTETERKEWGRRRRQAEELAARIDDWRMGAGMRSSDAKIEASDAGDIARLADVARDLYLIETAEPGDLAAMFNATDPGLRARDEAAGQRWLGLCEWMCAAVVTRAERGANDNLIAA
jgi:hypothetical protein